MFTISRIGTLERLLMVPTGHRETPAPAKFFRLNFKVKSRAVLINHNPNPLLPPFQYFTEYKTYKIKKKVCSYVYITDHVTTTTSLYWCPLYVLDKRLIIKCLYLF